MIISLAFSIALQIGEAFLGGSCRASYVEPCISISEFPYINYHRLVAIIQANFASRALLVLLVVLNPGPPFLLDVHSSF